MSPSQRVHLSPSADASGPTEAPSELLTSAPMAAPLAAGLGSPQTRILCPGGGASSRKLLRRIFALRFCRNLCGSCLCGGCFADG